MATFNVARTPLGGQFTSRNEDFGPSYSGGRQGHEPLPHGFMHFTRPRLRWKPCNWFGNFWGQKRKWIVLGGILTTLSETARRSAIKYLNSSVKQRQGIMAFGGFIPPLKYLSLIGRTMLAGAETARANNGVIEEITNNFTWRMMIQTSGGKPCISRASSYPSQQYSLPVPRKDMILSLPGKLRGRLLFSFYFSVRP